MSEIVFDRESHVYSVNGVIMPSVTQLLKEAGVIYSGPNYTQEAAARGSIIHEEIASIILHNDRPTSPHGYVFLDFMQYLGSKRSSWTSEVVVYNMLYGYAGTADIVGLINDVNAVIEIKTGAPASWHSMQVAAYAAALEIDSAYLLYITDTSFKLKKIDVKDSFNEFLSTAGLSCEEEPKVASLSHQAEYDEITKKYDALTVELASVTKQYVQKKSLFWEQHKAICAEEQRISFELEEERQRHKKRILELLCDNDMNIHHHSHHILRKSFLPEVTDEKLIPREFLVPDIAKLKKTIAAWGPEAENVVAGVKVVPQYALTIRAPVVDDEPIGFQPIA